MRVAQVVVESSPGGASLFAPLAALAPDLVLAFGSVARLQQWAPVLGAALGHASLVGCSTAGEISDEGVTDDSLVVTAVSFGASRAVQVSTELRGMEDSADAGGRLASALSRDGLRAVLVFGQGVQINGSAVLSGMTAVVGPGIPITGGLAGDGGAFARTWILDQAGVSETRLVCVGLYGDRLVFSHGSYGGWEPFGPARKVTRCVSNVLYELDGEPALDVYKRYLGDYAKDLPASGLLFPLVMLAADHQALGLTRTILAVDEGSGSLTLAGDIDPDGYLKLMHASTDALVEGAEKAAQAAQAMRIHQGPTLALMVSCVGRKLVIGGRAEEEVEAVADVFAADVTAAGFYSNGEMCPMRQGDECKLHNQTMTISCLSESL